MEKRKKETIWFIKYFEPLAMLKVNTHATYTHATQKCSKAFMWPGTGCTR